MILPAVTVEDVLSWKPCYSDETKVRDLAAPLGDRFDVLAVLSAYLSGELKCSAEDVLWFATHEEVTPTPILHEFGCRTAEWALVLVALGGAEIDPRSVEAIDTKRRWMRGEASDKELSAAWSAAWSAAGSAADASYNIRVEELIALLEGEP
jgi:acyl-CoA synthetase (AMP-forming)/AMP-acid ligase II